jgi:hypothetical protein
MSLNGSAKLAWVLYIRRRREGGRKGAALVTPPRVGRQKQASGSAAYGKSLGYWYQDAPRGAENGANSDENALCLMADKEAFS